MRKTRITMLPHWSPDLEARFHAMRPESSYQTNAWCLAEEGDFLLEESDWIKHPALAVFTVWSLGFDEQSFVLNHRFIATDYLDLWVKRLNRSTAPLKVLHRWSSLQLTEEDCACRPIQSLIRELYMSVSSHWLAFWSAGCSSCAAVSYFRRSSPSLWDPWDRLSWNPFDTRSLPLLCL